MKTPTQQAIEDAETVGWTWGDVPNDIRYPQIALMDPKFWQAVGKTRGWVPECHCGKEHPGDYFMTHGQWRANLHEFIDHLADGKTIDEALKAIE